MTDCVYASIFGEDENDILLDYTSNGVVTKLTCAHFLKSLFFHNILRYSTALRNVFDFFDDKYLTATDKEVQTNSLVFRNFIKNLIIKRKQ